MEELKQTVTNLPCDVATCWNSTYDMLDYVLSHQQAVDTMTQCREMGLRAFELTDDEWVILEELRDVLKARVCYVYVTVRINHCRTRSSKMPHSTFHD